LLNGLTNTTYAGRVKQRKEGIIIECQRKEVLCEYEALASPKLTYLGSFLFGNIRF